MAKDPICGMTVDEATSLRAERDGQTFHFCSEHCRQEFLARPSAQTTNAEGSHGGSEMTGQDHAHYHEHDHGVVKPSAGAKYFCPMCPDVESDKPGDCPKCGMALERNPTWVEPAAPKVIYTCPMHPEVEQDHPGNCPKCGMV
jgi:Cu+-exporting ATPase